MARTGWGRYLLQVALLAGAYFLAGKLGLSLAFVNPSATAVWPPTGIALAGFLILGYGVWPGVLLGAFLVNLTTAGSAATSAGIALGNTLEGLLGAFLANRWANGRRAFERPRDIFMYVALCAFLSTAVSATLGVTSLGLGGLASRADFGPIWITWWLGDAGGALVVAPLLVLWCAGPGPGWSRAQALEAAGMLLSLIALGEVAFGNLFPAAANSPLAFACVPVLIWSAFRFGPRETVTASFVLSCIAIQGAMRGAGPFVRATPHESLLVLQGFLSVMIVTTLALAAVVSERKRAQEALARRASEMARSNAELERFAYVASHDLQEPLRMVSSYVQLLARRYAGRLDADAGEFIRYAVEGAARMKEVIEGLLAYSRAGQGAAELAPTDCGAVLRKALDSLAVSIRESGAAVTSDPMPTVMGNEIQLVEVFENLIRNAIKFRREQPPRVHVEARPGNGGWLFCVRDNGIGIEPEYRERIFVLFQRLHGRDDYPGAGIGLAICKKIIAAHGGRIWVESEPGVGSEFYFTLRRPDASSVPGDGARRGEAGASRARIG